MQCSHCNQEHPENSKFCPVTGRKIIMPGVCPECGKSVDPKWRHCTHCGRKLILADRNSNQQEAQATGHPKASISAPELLQPRARFPKAPCLIIGGAIGVPLIVAAVVFFAVWKPDETAPSATITPVEITPIPTDTLIPTDTPTPTDTPIPLPTAIQSGSLLIEERGWIEILNTGTVNLEQETPTALNQLIVFHGPNAKGDGFSCKGCYVIEPLTGVKVNVPAEDINGKDIIFRSGESYQYLIKGSLSEKTVDDFFLGSLPIFEVTYLERVK